MPESPIIALYGKPDCHLCDEAEAMVKVVAQEFGQAYRKVDIASDAGLLAEYRYRIPVVRVDNRTSLDWPMTPGQLRRAVQAAIRP